MGREQVRRAGQFPCSRRTMISLFLMCLFQGCTCNTFVKEARFAPFVYAWDGACALLKCEYILYGQGKQLSNLTLYKNPVYNDEEKKWEGTIVYTHWGNRRTSTESFRNRARFLGNVESDCTLLIQEVRVNDSGQYGVRLEEGTSNKWMVQPFLSLNITDYAPKPHIVVAAAGITEKQPTTITCSIDYHCPEYPIQLHWEGPVQGANATQYQGSTSAVKTTNTLSFVPSWQHDQRVLRCLLSSVKDTRTSSESEITLDVKHTPKHVEISLEGKAQTIKEGESLTLKCLVISSNPPVSEYNWFKEGDTRSKQKGQLFNIKRVSAKDSGKYLCEASNSFGTTKSSSMDIDVQFGPKKAELKLNVNGNIKEGDYVTITCNVQSNPSVTTYHWYKDGRYLSQTTSVLSLQQVSDDDSGYYECRVYHTMGNASSPPERLNVLYAPKRVAVAVQARDKAWIKEGDRVQLDCTCNSSNPKVSLITWYRNNRQIPAAEKKVFASITAEESGKYVCELQNTAGNSRSPEVLIDVKYAPKDVKLHPTPSPKLEEGDAAQLHCTVRQSNPEANDYKWYKDNEIYQGSWGSEIHFPSLKSSDSGSYICEAANDVAATKSNTILLIVQYGPRNVVISLDPSVSLIEDANVTLICDADALPKAHQYFWYKKSQHFKTTYSNRLLLGKIKKDEAGLYYCEAINDIAAKRSNVITLDIYYSSHSIAKFVAVALGVVFFVVLMVVLIVRFEVWQKMQQRRVSSAGEADDRSDTFFVLNKKRTRDNQYDGLGNAATSLDPEYEESLNYSTIQFPSSHMREESETTRASINHRSSTTPKRDDASAIYSLVKKPCKAPQVTEASIDYENSADKTEDDIKYATIINLACKPKGMELESESDSEVFSVEYAELKL
ncbi:B-cell receptor CD22-like [Pleurodeles waltl]|uniref:B-cell receptor CD22-like n=1 Tax=Pleurodeles waltl TaxID=8319 RepID=UPI00370985AD